MSYLPSPANARSRESRTDGGGRLWKWPFSLRKQSLGSVSEIRLGSGKVQEKAFARRLCARVHQGSVPAPQRDALREAGCGWVFMETPSGAQRDSPELKGALDYLRAGEKLALWKLDRLARSVRQFVETDEDFAKRESGLRGLTRAIDTTSPGGRLVFHGDGRR